MANRLGPRALLITVALLGCGDGGDDDDSVGIDAAVSAIDARRPDSAAGTPDASAPDGSVREGVACGELTCVDQVCCSDCSPDCTFTCEAAGACEADIYECDGPEDCDGDAVCCLSFGGDASTMCGGGPCPELCHADEDCTDPRHVCCPAGGSPDGPFTPSVCTAPGDCR